VNVPGDLEIAIAGILALALVLWAVVSLQRLRAGRRHGSFVRVDDGTVRERLVSTRYRLVGSPDEIRRRPDGRPVPVEWKSRRAPRRGVPPSHRVQVEAYCLLLEETTGVPPPYGVVRYSDGAEAILPWDEAARAEVLRIRWAMAGPYDGRADPSPSKCARCRWRPGCDARAPS